MVKKIIFSLILGIIATLFIAQQDKWLAEKIGKAIHAHFTKLLDSSISYSHNEINFFNPYVVFYNIQVKPKNNADWSWQCKKLRVRFSWLNLLLYRTLSLGCALDELEINTCLENNKLSISSHLEKLLKSSNQSLNSIYLQSLLLHNAILNIYDQQHTVLNKLYWSSESYKINKLFKTRIDLKNVTCTYKNKEYIDLCKGQINLGLNDMQSSMYIDNCSFRIPDQDVTCFVSGNWSNNQGNFTVYNQEHSLLIDATIEQKTDNIYIKSNGQIPLSFIKIYTSLDLPINGLCIFTCKGTSDALQGNVNFNNVTCYKKKICDTASSPFFYKDGAWQGNILMNIPRIGKIDGKWFWNTQENNGTISLLNNEHICIPYTSYWQLDPNGASVSIDFNNSSKFNLHYSANFYNALLDKVVLSKGLITIDGKIVQAHGSLYDYMFDLDLDLNSSTKIQRYTCYNPDGKQVIDVHPIMKDRLKGYIDYCFIRQLIKNIYGYDAQGEGVLLFESIFNNDVCNTKIQLSNGTIRLPQTYNFINQFNAQCTYNIPKKILKLSNIKCGLHTGSLYAAYSVIWVDDNGHISFMHAPIIFDKCLFNIKKDLFALISGNVLFTKNNNLPYTITGNIFLDKAQLKENLFSNTFQRTIFKNASSNFEIMQNVECNFNIETKNPIRVDTSFLEADAQVHLNISKSITNPTIVGSINLLSGNLKFPYKSLKINKGSLYFLSNQPYNPMVEIIAKNKIKKYNIGLQVTGSLQNRHIMLESTPPLSEEQIVSLLLVGSQEESLSMIMPALIMQNMRQLIFGSNQSSVIRKIFSRENKSFNINLIPSFSDQTGRGGLRGTLEIDVNDRWRALIQKNFNLSEDTRFELEYLLSDDITVRGIRNERRDISTEVEMRWKF